MKIRYTRYPCAGFWANSTKLNVASFAGHLENTATPGWKIVYKKWSIHNPAP